MAFGSSLLDEVLSEYTDGQGWQLLCNRGSTQVNCKVVSDVWALVRLSRTVSVPLEHIVALVRPESLLGGAATAMSHGLVAEAEVVRSFSAGDVLGRVRWPKDGTGLLWAVLRDRSLRPAYITSDGCYRLTLRRNFPTAGTVVSTCIPLDTDRFELREKLGAQSTTMLILEPEAGGTTRMAVVEKVSRRNLWLLPLVPRWTLLESIEDKSLAFHEQAAKQWGFVVLRIRKCCKGPPLLPTTWPAPLQAQWVCCVVDSGEREFRLARYLQQLLKAVGLHSLEIFDDVDGGRLVFYQAAMRRTSW